MMGGTMRTAQEEYSVSMPNPRMENHNIIINYYYLIGSISFFYGVAVIDCFFQNKDNNLKLFNEDSRKQQRVNKENCLWKT